MVDEVDVAAPAAATAAAQRHTGGATRSCGTQHGLRLALHRDSCSAARRPGPHGGVAADASEVPLALLLDAALTIMLLLLCCAARRQANKAGADEGLMLDPQGFVCTCNSTNFFIVRKCVAAVGRLAGRTSPCPPMGLGLAAVVVGGGHVACGYLWHWRRA